MKMMLVKTDEFSQKVITQIGHDLQEVLSKEVEFETEIVDKNPKDKIGMFGWGGDL